MNRAPISDIVTAAEALQVVQKHDGQEIHLLLTDVVMPLIPDVGSRRDFQDTLSSVMPGDHYCRPLGIGAPLLQGG